MSQSQEKGQLELNVPKLFGRWDVTGIDVKNKGLARYLNLSPIYIPHSYGRHSSSRFGKEGVHVVERLINDMMRHGRMGGRKEIAMGIVYQAFSIIEAKTGKNPVEVLVRAIENAAILEGTTRIIHGGIRYRVAVDVSPMRQLDLALRNITEGAREAAKGSPKPIDECLADEIIAASENDARSFAIRAKHEEEQIAMAAR
ncbi:MAG: 30S ribosomal protein S7 [Candidatus Marsarchaeota archaeon]